MKNRIVKITGRIECLIKYMVMRYCLFLLYIFLFSFHCKASETDSLVTRLRQAKQDTGKMHILVSLTDALMYSHPDSAKNYARQGIRLADQLNDQAKKGTLLKSLGDINDINGNFAEAENFYRKAIPLLRKSNDQKGLAHAYLARGLTHIHLGAYPDALKYNQKALEIARKADYHQLFPSCFTNIGIVHKHQEDFERALKYFKQALEKFKAHDETRGIGKSYGNIGNIYQHQGKHSKAIEYHQKTIRVYDSIHFTYGIAKAKANIAVNLNLQEKFSQAIEYFEQSLELFEKLGAKDYTAHTMGNIASVYISFASEFENTEATMDKYNKAIEYSQKELEMAREISSLSRERQAYKNLYKAYEDLNQYKKAFHYHKRYTAIQDSLFNKEKSKQVNRLEAQYQTEKKERENELLRKENQLNEARIKNQQRLGIAIGVGLVGALTVAVLFFRSRQKERRYNQELQEKNQQISDQKEELKNFNEQLEEASRFKEAMTRMMVHDLKNPLNLMINFPDLTTPENAHLVRQYSKHMLNIVMNVLDVYKADKSQIQLNTSAFNLYEMAKEATDEIQLFAEEKQIYLKNNIEKDILVSADYEILKRIIVNLMSNAVKYTPPEGSITVRSLWKNDQLKVLVTDTGIGISPQAKQNLFNQVGNNHSNNNSDFSTGIGLYFCKMAINALGSEIHVDSEKNQGTTFWFVLPTARKQKYATTDDEQNTHRSVRLTNDERETIQPVIDELKQYEVYELTGILNVLDKIDPSRSPNIAEWKEAVSQTVYACNNVRYKKLLEQ